MLCSVEFRNIETLQSHPRACVNPVICLCVEINGLTHVFIGSRMVNSSCNGPETGENKRNKKPQDRKVTGVESVWNCSS